MNIDPRITAAIIGGTSGALISLITSYIITKLKLNQEVKIWNTEFAVNYSKLVFENPEAARQLSRQFAIGLLIVKDLSGSTLSKHFIPYQCKVSVGRNPDNDIVLTDKRVSRDHGVFFYRGNKALYMDYLPLNKTLLNGKNISNEAILKSEDELLIGGTTLKFIELK